MRSQHYEGSFSNLDPDKLGIPDELISVWLDVEPWRETEDRSWSKHRTQANSARFWEQLPEELQRQWSKYECFQLAASRVGRDLTGENDLFAHIK